jgi:ubiquinone/menaquinone biosynthesis C-methylase UbiE
MGWWSREAVPRVINKMMDTPADREIRARVCAPLAGDVLELGFGSGLNLPHMPATVTSLAVVEPSEVGRRLATARIEAATVPVKFAGLDGQRLDVDDDSVDAVLTTWTLCTIPDAGAALREVRRVLRPGGAVHFAEHGLAEKASTVKWQKRLEPMQRRMAGGCHLTREIDKLFTDAGFTIERLDRYDAPKVPKPCAAMYEGVARPA